MLLSFFYQQSHPRVNHEAFVVTFFVMVIAAAAYLAKVTNMGDATFAGRKALHVFGVMAGVWLGWFHSSSRFDQVTQV